MTESDTTTPATPEPRSFWRQAKAALGGAELDYTQGSLSKAVWLLAIPMVLEMVMESTFAIVDVFFVADLGADAVAAVGLTEAMLTIVYAVAFGMAVAATALVARRIGEKNKAGAVRAGTSAIAIGVIAGLVIGPPCAFFADDLLRAMGASPSVVETGTRYAQIVLGGNVVVLLLHLANGVFRGAGDAALAMRALALANGINIVLDPCLIYGWGPFPELGLTGAAVATTTGRTIGVLYQLRMLRRGTGRLALRGPACRVEPPIMIEILRLSAGTVGQFLIVTTSWVVLVTFLADFGSVVLAGYTIAMRIVAFAFMPAWGFTNAAATLVGQNLGAQKPDRAERAVWLTGLYTMGFLAVVTIVFVTLAPELVGIFTEDPDTTTVAVAALRTVSYGYVFYAWGMATMQGFNGAGDTKTPTWIHFFCFWLFEIPLAWALSQHTELREHGVFWSVCIAESSFAVVGVLMFRRGKWKSAQVAADVVTRA
ncbi:MAG: MATE family efflux transporter [Planctomycetota bacterium]